MKAIFTAISLFSIVHLSAQNWSLVMPNDTLVYEKLDNHQFFTVWVDSTQINGTDTTYFMNRISPGDSFALLQNSCDNSGNSSNLSTHYNLHKEQFIGGAIIKSGSSYVIDYRGISYYFHPEQTLGASWVFSSLNSNLISVSALDTMFLPLYQVTDSIKTFAASNFSLTISKNYGIIEMNELNTTSPSYKMVGVQNLGLGETIPMGTDYFDYEIGDVFFTESGAGGSQDYIYSKEMITILTKTTIGDTLIYLAKRNYHVIRYNSEAGIQTIFPPATDTITLEYWTNMLSFINAYPNTIELSYGLHCGYTSFENDSLPKNVLIYKNADGNIIRSNATEISTLPGAFQEIFSYCTTDTTNLLAEIRVQSYPFMLQAGLGVLSEAYLSLYSCDYALIGYKKMDGTSWGDTTYITSVEKMNFSTNIRIYPNPAQNFITIETEKSNGTTLVELYDLQGRLTNQKTFEKTIQMDVSPYASGVYFLVIKDDNGFVLHREKIIIQ